MYMRMLPDVLRMDGWMDILVTQERREIKLWLAAVGRDIGEDPTLLSVSLLSHIINNYWGPNAHQAHTCVYVCVCILVCVKTYSFLWFIVPKDFFHWFAVSCLYTMLYLFIPFFLHFSFIIHILYGGLMKQYQPLIRLSTEPSLTHHSLSYQVSRSFQKWLFISPAHDAFQPWQKSIFLLSGFQLEVYF